MNNIILERFGWILIIFITAILFWIDGFKRGLKQKEEICKKLIKKIMELYKILQGKTK